MSLTAILGVGQVLLDKFIEDPGKKREAELELLRMHQAGEFKLLDTETSLSLAQIEVNKQEAAQAHIFNSGWRPAAGWVCVFGLAYEVVLRTLLPWVLTVCGAENVPPLPTLDSVLSELLFGMLGLGGIRSADRWRRLKSLEQLASRSEKGK